MLDRIRIVLCGTSHPGNIGAAARAMKTMGLRRLALVSPLQFPSAEATARASGADDVLGDAEIVQSLPEALAGVSFAVGTSARLRRVPLRQHTPRELATTLAGRPAEEEIAIVFGREASGLTNAEIDCCHALVHIPSDPGFSSLNLAAAVQIVSYEVRMQMLAAGEIDRPVAAAAEEARPDVPAMESFFGHLEETLYAIRFLVPGQSESMLKRLRRLFHRAAPTLTELDILRGILSRTQTAASRADPDRDPPHT